MCGLIWLPRPRTKRPFVATLQVVGGHRQRHRRAGERDRDRRCRARCARCAAPRAPAGGTGRGRSRRCTRRRSRASSSAAGPGADARRTLPPSIAVDLHVRSLSSAGGRRYRAVPDGSASLSHPGGTVRSSELRTPVVAVAERLLVVQGVPARVPVLLPRAAPRAAVGSGPPRARWCTGRSSCSSTARPTSASLDAALADLAARPRRARRPTPTSPTSSLTDEEWAQFDADAELLVRALLRARGPPHRPPHRPGAEARSRPRPGAPARRDRPPRARRARRVRGHRLQDRLGAVGVLGGEEPERRAHVRAAVRAHARQAPGARAALLPRRSPRRSSPPPPTSRSAASSARPSRCASAIATACEPRRLPPAARAALRLLHVQAVLPGARRRPARRRRAARSRAR